MKGLFALLLALSVLTTSADGGPSQIASNAVYSALLNGYQPEKIAAHTPVIHGPSLSRIKESKGFTMTTRTFHCFLALPRLT